MNDRILFCAIAILSAVLLFVPIRAGDLAGYDDAHYALMAKEIVRSGDWLTLRQNGLPALEHPPLVPWMQAALFEVFGYSDYAAKLPSALCGWATILLVAWLARNLTGSPLTAVVAAFVMATSIYFLKYAARAMTDVPCTFFFVCAISSWTLTQKDRRWYLLAGFSTALTLITRGMIGFALPLIFICDLIARRTRPPLRYAVASVVLAIGPLAAWYLWLVHITGPSFFDAHEAFLRKTLYAPLTPTWRRYTGAFEYAWMLAKSYWPWLPAMIAGLAVVARKHDRRLFILLFWSAAVFVLCAVARSRVLRYMLPEYPAFAILAAIGISAWMSERFLRRTLTFALPILACVVAAIAIHPPAHWHAAEIRPIAQAATLATPDHQRIIFYDEAQPRFDETNQMEWYGYVRYYILLSPAELQTQIAHPQSAVWVVDRQTYRANFVNRIAHDVLARSGHLLCIRLQRLNGAS